MEEKVIDTGPLVTGCVVDLKAGGYQCATLNQDPFFLPFKDAKAMECVSPDDLESFLKACKKKQVLQVTWCDVKNASVQCVDPKGASLSLDLSQMDNYFCLESKDKKRVLERCDQAF